LSVENCNLYSPEPFTVYLIVVLELFFIVVGIDISNTVGIEGIILNEDYGIVYVSINSLFGVPELVFLVHISPLIPSIPSIELGVSNDIDPFSFPFIICIFLFTL